jgi:tRNA threonylcarbamoyladenosine biosynthesis protein TsaB
MALILIIDTSTEKASIALSQDDEAIGLSVNEEQKDHAGWIHQAIENLLASRSIALKDLKAVAVTAGPGSYTGLRVGLATAKGLCYALSLPLITVNTLEAMAVAAIAAEQDAELYCPMIDARRMEVFTAVYDRKVNLILPPLAMVLDETAFQPLLEDKRMLFFGNGHTKVQQIITHPNAIFRNVPFDASCLAGFIMKKYNLSQFADLAYTEPVYVKEVYTNALRKS